MPGARWSWRLAPFSCNLSKKPGFLEASSHNDCWAWRCQTRRLRRNNALYALLLAECSVVPGNKCFIEARANLHSSSYQLCRTLGQACLPGHPKTATAAWAMHDCKTVAKQQSCSGEIKTG